MLERFRCRLTLRTEFNLLWQSSTSDGLGALRKGSNRQAVVAMRPSKPKFSGAVDVGDRCCGIGLRKRNQVIWTVPPDYIKDQLRSYSNAI